MATMTPTTGAIFVPKVWAKDIMMARTNALVATNLVDHSYQGVGQVGDTVHIPSIAEMTADVMTPGTALVPVAPTETEQTLVINKYYGKAFEIQEVLKKQSSYDLRRPYTEVMGRALAKAMDTSILSEAANALAGNIQTAVAALTYNGIVDATTLLDKNNVPQDDRALILNAVGVGDLRKVTQFTSWNDTGRPGVREKALGIVGEIYGAPVYLTNAVTRTTSDQNLLLHKSAITAVVQIEPQPEYFRDILKKTDIVSVSTLWGVKTVRPDHMVVLQRT